MKKILSVVLSVCMLMMYSVPVFAYSSNDATKVQLSDQAMAEAMGGNGTLDVDIMSPVGAQTNGGLPANDLPATYTVSFTNTGNYGAHYNIYLDGTSIASGNVSNHSSVLATGSTGSNSGWHYLKAELLSDTMGTGHMASSSTHFTSSP